MKRIFEVLKEVASRPSGAIGLLLVLLHIAIAISSPWIVPYDFKAISALDILTPPDAKHLFGTDQMGRDVLTRTLLGGREAILVTAIATPIAVFWGGLLGIYLGLVGGRRDDVIMRIVDAFLSLPWILKMLLLIVTFGINLLLNLHQRFPQLQRLPQVLQQVRGVQAIAAAPVITGRLALIRRVTNQDAGLLRLERFHSLAVIPV
jgi:ABC-type dipeptide/oligopeptide/nickel transport system permease subunit